jgi:hypothetical protein
MSDRRYRHYWTCDTCHKFVHQGAVRCTMCVFDVRMDTERRRDMERRLKEIDLRLRVDNAELRRLERLCC